MPEPGVDPGESMPNAASLGNERMLMPAHGIQVLPIADLSADPSLAIWNGNVIYTATNGYSLVIQALPHTKLALDLSRINAAPAAKIWDEALAAGRYPAGMEYLKQLNEFMAADLCVIKGELYCYVTVGIVVSRTPEVDREVRGFRDLYRLFLLKCDSPDPLGPWSIVKRIVTPWDYMAIDPVAVECNHGLIFFWAGHTDRSYFLNTMAMPMLDAETLATAKPSILLEPLEDHEEEVNEGPTPFVMNGAMHGMFYSRGNVWKNNYRLEYADCHGSPLDPAAWRKRPTPVWSGEDSPEGMRGLGHGQVVQDPDGGYFWLLYQYKRGIHSRPEHRAVAAQTFTLDSDGQPNFGAFVPVPPVSLPPPYPLAASIHAYKVEELADATKEYIRSIQPDTAPYLK